MSLALERNHSGGISIAVVPDGEARIAARIEENILGQLTIVVLHDAAGLALWNSSTAALVDKALRARGFVDGDVVKIEAVR